MDYDTLEFVHVVAAMEQPALLAVPPGLLTWVVHQLPVHPREWSMLAATCTQLRDAVADGREQLRAEVCGDDDWCDQWSGKQLVQLASDGETLEALRLVVAGALVDYIIEEKQTREDAATTALMWAAKRGDT